MTNCITLNSYVVKEWMNGWAIRTWPNCIVGVLFCSSFDVRGRSFSSALEWSDTMIFGPRASYDSGTKPSSLRLDSVQLDDQGVYRCRVDFRHSPTRNFQINLTVIGKQITIDTYCWKLTVVFIDYWIPCSQFLSHLRSIKKTAKCDWDSHTEGPYLIYKYIKIIIDSNFLIE